MAEKGKTSKQDVKNNEDYLNELSILHYNVYSIVKFSNNYNIYIKGNVMAKLKDILKEFIGEQPSSNLKKMKWNPVTEAPIEEPAIEEPATDVLRLQRKFGGILEPIIKKINTSCFLRLYFFFAIVVAVVVVVGLNVFDMFTFCFT